MANNILLKSVKFLFPLMLLFMTSELLAQNLPVTEQQVLDELKKRGITEEEAIKVLTVEGIDVENLEKLPPSELARLQTILENYQKEKQARINDSLKMELDTIPDVQMKDEEVEPQFEIENEPKELSEFDGIKIYGEGLFRKDQSRVFDNGENFTAPDNYILGVGDKLSVSIFGNSQGEDNFEIGKDGYINVLDQGRIRIFLKGLTLGEAESKIRKVYNNIYSFRSGEFQVGLSEFRKVQISVFGEAKSSGTFTISASNTALNALLAVGGPNENGSYRGIQLMKSEGESQRIDVYDFLNNPGVIEKYYLSNNDVIVIPNRGNVVDISGAIQRPLKYEMLNNETVDDLLQFAGGRTKNAVKSSLQVIRYEKDQRVILDIESRNGSFGNFTLLDGDSIFVRSVDPALLNGVEISGEVAEEGFFALENDMRVADLLDKAGVLPEAYLTEAVLRRQNFDSTYVVEFINLLDILNNRNSSDNFILKKNDKLFVYPQSRFVDRATITVEGAVRYGDTFPYDVSQKVDIKKALILAGGLRSDAGNIAIVHRQDPFKENQKEYVTVFLDKLDDPQSGQNIILQPNDRLEVVSENYFDQETTISVEGAVNSPGEFQYGKNMKVVDAIALARGFKIGAQTNKIEISRVVIKDNQPTETVIANLDLDRNFEKGLSKDAGYELMPFDKIFVRYVPDFELQQNIIIKGEVTLPGPYSVLSDNERISSIVLRAGGLTKEAFPEGAKLLRKKGEESGYIVMRLDEVLKDDNSRYNYILKDGDVIEIPKQKDFVTIKGATRAYEVVADETLGSNNEIQVAYHKGKNAKFYIDYYAGGIAENGSRKLIFVEHANGEIKQTKRRFIFGFNYPEVYKGSVITVRSIPVKEEEENREKEDVDWTKILGDSVAQVMSVLTLILLVQRL